MFMGFTKHFYIIFGTNLLTGGPAQIVVFLPIAVFRRKGNIKRSPNGMKPSGELFLEWKQSRRLGVDVREASRKPRGKEARPNPLGAPPPSWAPCGSPDLLLSPIYISIYPKNIGEQNRSGVPPQEASVATENQSRPLPTPCWRGESLSGGHLHHPSALHDEEGVVLPRG